MNKELLYIKLKNITIFQLLAFFISLYILYAIVDITYKRIELNKYDLEKIVSKIDEKKSGTEIGFQSIIVKYSKSYRSKGGQWRSKRAEKHLYIEDGKLKKVNKFVLIPGGIVFLFGYFAFLILEIDIQYLKLKDLKKVIKTRDAVSLFFASIIFLVFICLIVPLEIRNVMNYSPDVTNKYLQVNTLDGYLK